MSRLFLACSLIAALSTSALADRTEPTFARPPTGWQAKQEPALGGDLARAPRYTPPVVDRDAVRAKLVAARADNLARFRAYQRKGVFPSNTYAEGRLNVWRDEAGNLCAAATIINASGATDLVEQVAEESNFIRLADVTTGPLMDWILTSGLTQAEIAAIQEPFSPVMMEPGIAPVVAVDPRLRRAEDQRLMRTYRQVDALIVKSEESSIELALNRLMARPALARSFVDG
jgi:hypothetical protein